jgi:hypothetical protein
VILGSSTVTLNANNPVQYAFAYLYYNTGTFHGDTSSFVFSNPAAANWLVGNGWNPPLYNVTFASNNSTLWGATINNKLIFEQNGFIGYGDTTFHIHEVEFRGDAVINDSRIYHKMTFAPGKHYTFFQNTTQYLVPYKGEEGQFIAQGLPGQYIEIKSSDFNSPATIYKNDYDGTSTCTKYLFLTAMTHTGTEDIYVPTPGGNVFNNTGWLFFPCNPCPASIPLLDATSITVGCPPGKAKLVLKNLKPDEWANWYTDPAAMMNLVHSGNNLFEPTITGPTTYYARVYSDGGLCESTVILTVNITTTTPPATFNVSGGGTYCTGSNSAIVHLDGSETGVQYVPYLNGNSVGNSVNGTGSALTFGGLSSSGAYTIVATKTNTSCSATMNSVATFTINPALAPTVLASSNSPICGTFSLLLKETGGQATSWSWTGPNGFASMQQNPVLPNPAPSNSGDYTVVITGSNGCTNNQTIHADIYTKPTTTLLPNTLYVQRGTIISLVVPNVQPGQVPVWYASDMKTLLYSDPANNFQSTASVGTTYFGGVRDVVSGCVSDLVGTVVFAYYPLTVRVETNDASCSDAYNGSAQAIVNGGRQSIGTGNYKISSEQYGLSGLRTLVADFNNDGYPDVYNCGGDRFDDVWLNNGDGKFTYQLADYNSTKSAIRAVKGDFNEDGNLDVYVCNGATASDKILINNGLGQFTEQPANYGIASSEGAAVGDLNGDGHADIMVVGESFVIVLYGNGNGTFTQGANFGIAGDLNRAVSLGDLDGDSDLDAFVVAGAGPGATLFPPSPDRVYINDGQGHFTVSPTTYGNNEPGWDVKLGDLNKDGKLDAFVANWGTFPNQVYFGNGDGTFTASSQVFPSEETRSVELADTDGDGDLDAVIANLFYYSGTSSAAVKQWHNDGTGHFVLDPVTYPEAVDIGVADLDRDGDLDIFCASNYDAYGAYNGLHHVLFNDNSPVTPYQYQWSSGNQVYTPDLRDNLQQGDSHVTVTDAVGNTASADFHISANDPIVLNATSTPAACATAVNGTATVTVSGGGSMKLVFGNQAIGNSFEGESNLVDLDNDGDLDILAGFYNRVIGINDGTGHFAVVAEPSLPVGCYPIVVGDLNGDGIKDLLGTTANGREFKYYKGNGNLTFQAPVTYQIPGSGEVNSIQLADLDGDGDLDAFIADQAGRSCTVWLNDGNGGFTQKPNMLATQDNYTVRLGDLNGDGFIDAFCSTMGSGDAVYLNDGQGNFSLYFRFPSGISSESAFLGDLDGDGDLDIFVDCWGVQASRVYFNNGDGSFTISPQFIHNLGESRDFSIGDMDGDGDLDIVCGSDNYKGYLWLNDGTGHFREYNMNGPTYIRWSSPLQVGDVDGDGRLDVTTNGNGINVVFNKPMTYTYLWSNGKTTATVSGLSPGMYQVTVSDYWGCQATTSVTVNNLNTQPTAIAAATAAICEGGSIYLTESGGAAVSWAWSGPNNFTSTQQNPVINNQNILASGIYTVTVTDANGCTNSASTPAVTVLPFPTVDAVNPQSVCNGGSTAPIIFSGSYPNTIFNWTNNATSIGLPASGTGDIASFPGTNAGSTPVVATITVMPVLAANGAVCYGQPLSTTITVNPIPNVIASPTMQSVCDQTSTTTITFIGNVPGTTFTWTNTTTSIGLASSGFGNIPFFTAHNSGTLPVAGIITVTPNANGCPGTPATATITVNPAPNVVATPAMQSVCHNTGTTPIVYSGAIPNTTFSWTNTTVSIGLAASGTGDIGSFTAINNGTTPVVSTITIIPSIGGCPGTPISATITVNPAPTVVAMPLQQTMCANTSTTAISFNSNVSGTAFNWTNN